MIGDWAGYQYASGLRATRRMKLHRLCQGASQVRTGLKEPVLEIPCTREKDPTPPTPRTACSRRCRQQLRCGQRLRWLCWGTSQVRTDLKEPVLEIPCTRGTRPNPIESPVPPVRGGAANNTVIPGALQWLSFTATIRAVLTQAFTPGRAPNARISANRHLCSPWPPPPKPTELENPAQDRGAAPLALPPTICYNPPTAHTPSPTTIAHIVPSFTRR